MHTKLITLTDQVAISAVFEQGSSYANRFFVVRASLNRLTVPRFVFAVGKRYGNAVQRNRIKRQIREIIRQNLAIIPSGIDYGIITRRAGHGGTFAELRSALVDCLIRAAAFEQRGGERT